MKEQSLSSKKRKTAKAGSFAYRMLWRDVFPRLKKSLPHKQNTYGLLRASALLLLVLTLSLIACPVRDLAAEQFLVEEVVASVNDEAITRSQVEQEARFVLAERNYYWAGPLVPSLLEKVLQRYIAKMLIYNEMEKRRSINAKSSDTMMLEETSREMAQLFGDFEKSFQSKDNFERFLKISRMSRESLAAKIYRNNKIEKYMKKRLEALSQVSQSEIEKELEKREKTTTLAATERRQLRELVQKELQEQKYKDALESWLEGLRERSRVLQIVHFSSPQIKQEAGSK